MKKIRYVLIVAMVVFLAVGLWIARDDNGKYEKAEFIMDTTCSVTLYGEDAETATEAIFDEVRRIDGLMNMYNEKSEVWRINNAEANQKIKVSKDTYYVIETALEICRESGGAFDITVAPLMKLWNFSGETPKVPGEGEIRDALSEIDYRNVILENGDTVYKLRTETQIDLGAAAKGYAGDRAVEIAKKYNLSGGIIDLGGNILCFGENPNSDDGKWNVGIQIPFQPTGSYEKTVKVTDKAIVTSGTYQRYFEESGKLYHHILNPETGYPSEQKYNSVTIVADSSLRADCLATAIFVMGEKGKEMAEKYNGEVYYE